jgi:hypothetical protein
MSIGTPTSLGSQHGTSSTLVITTTAAIVAGVLVVVAISTSATGGAKSVSSVSDGTNTYAKAVAFTTSANDTGELWYIANAAAVGSGASLTVTFSGTPTSSAAIAAQVSGIRASSPFDSSAHLDQTSSGSQQNPSLSSGTPSSAQEIIFGWAGSYLAGSGLSYSTGGVFTTIGSSASQSSDRANVGLSYRIISTKTAQIYSPNFGTTPDGDFLMTAGFIGAVPAAGFNMPMLGM